MQHRLETQRNADINDGQSDEHLERTEGAAVDEQACMGQVHDPDLGNDAGGQKQKDELAGQRRIHLDQRLRYDDRGKDCGAAQIEGGGGLKLAFLRCGKAASQNFREIA